MVTFSSRHGRIAQLAGGQHGNVTREQLLGLGVASSTIALWIARGWLIVVHAGVYALSYRRVEPVSLAMAAVLAAGPGAVLSHDSALALWGLRRWPIDPEVIARGCVRRAGIRAHRSRTLTEAETTVQLGLPVTRAARAISDMGRRLSPRQRARLTNDARLRKILSADEAYTLLGHHRNATRSGNEDEMWRWLVRTHSPLPISGATVNGREVDAYYPGERVILEMDEFATHCDPVTFASDRERDADNLDRGQVLTVRVLRERLTAAEAARLKRILKARVPQPAQRPLPRAL